MSIDSTDYNYNEENNIITLSDEDGNDLEFEFLDVIEYEEEEYIVLLPPDDDEVVILKIDSNDDSETEDYIGVEDEELLEKLFELFKDRNSDIFNFSD